jgi:hypothetical protein
MSTSGKKKRTLTPFLLTPFLCLLLVTPTLAWAQEADTVHPFLNDRFLLAVGAFARAQNFDIRADGSLPEAQIDFDETLGVDDDDISGSLNFRWKYGSKWSLWGQAWKVKAGGGGVLTEDVKFEDLVFQEGTTVTAEVKNTVIRAFFGRIISAGPHHEFGLGLGFHWLELGAYIEGEALIDGTPSGFQRGRVDASSPLPNLGAWYYFSPSSRWLFEARLDWLEASIGDYSGGIWNSSAGVQFQASRHLGIALNYQYFSLNVDVDNDNWRGGAKLRYSGPFFGLTANW